MSGPADRGKVSEKAVRDVLKDLEKAHMHFTFNRCYDAHSAGGRMPAQAGDFQAFYADTRNAYVVLSQCPIGPTVELKDVTPFQFSRNFIVEVKEVKHDFRLPHGNYSTDKVARVQKRVLAGTEAIVMVLHTTTKVWRAVPFDVFRTRTGGSWDLREWPEVQHDAALKEFFGIA